MDIFNLFGLFNLGEKKCKSSNTGISVGVLIVLVTVIPGAILKFSSSVHDGSGLWKWLWHGEASVEADFSTIGGREQVVDLNGDWRFAVGDDEGRALPGFDDSSWSVINPASGWEGQGYQNYNGYAWYRRSFNMDAENLSLPLYAFLGKIDDVDEVFINGDSIGGQGGLPPDYSSAWNVERVYRVPSDLLHVGANVIAIRVYDGGGGGGMAGTGLGLYTSTLPRPLIDLTGEWEFAKGNDPSWKARPIEEGEFHSIQVPAYWDYAGYKNYDGHAWYRKTFGRLPVTENETLILFLGKIDDTDETFLNGERIGGTSGRNGVADAGPSYHDINRRYEFPDGLLRETNVLAVHVYDGQQGGGIYTGPVGIMRKTDFIEYQKRAAELKKWRFDEAIDWLLGR